MHEASRFSGRRILTALLLLCAHASTVRAQASTEHLLTSEAAYNPTPSPDGKVIAYVRTGWNRHGLGGMGRSHLVSEVAAISAEGKPIGPKMLADAFMAGWTQDGSAIICYRDWSYGLVKRNGSNALAGKLPSGDFSVGGPPLRSGGLEANERAAYLSSREKFIWTDVIANNHSVIESGAKTIAEYPDLIGETIVPSPDERYLAIFGSHWDQHLRVFDMKLHQWSDLGEIVVYPSYDEWDWYKATWNPWFADSQHLAYISGSKLMISDPRGASKREFAIGEPAGLPVPSPDGKSVAYVTFEPRPMALRSDLQFFGGSTIWIQPVDDRAKRIAATNKNSATTLDLKWLGIDALVFDRFQDETTPEHARIWKITVVAAPNATTR